MKKMLTLNWLLVCLLLGTYSMAQTIQGTVTDDNGVPLTGASVFEKGTTNGSITDLDGKYKLELRNTESILVISYTGFQEQELLINGRSIIDIELVAGAVLDEVVVTALGVSKEKKSLGYAVSQIESSEITEVASPNVVSALYGKAAGVQIKTNPSGATAGVNVVIRGNNSITGFNQPLFVVDGIPIDHGDSDFSRWGGAEAGNGAADINPEDVESISILKGANASALYGSRAANGVVLITTKSGQGNQRGLGIEISSSYTMEEVAYLPNLQNTFGSGLNSQVFRTNDEGENIYHETWPSFGPRMEGQMLRWWDGELRPYSPQPNNIRDIYNTGFTRSNTIALSKSLKNGINFRLSYTNFGHEGTFPGVEQQRNVFSLNSKIDLADNLDVSVVGNYYDIETTNRPRRLGGLVAYEWPRSTKLDLVLDRYKEDGFFNGAISGDPAPGIVRNFMNEWWIANENNTVDDKGRVIGNVTFNYRPFKGINIRGRVGTDFTNTDFITEEASRAPVNSGLYRVQKRKTQLNYSELLVSYTRPLTDDIELSVTGGGIISTESGTFTSVETNGFIVPNWFSLNNSQNQRNSRGDRFEERQDAVFGVLNLSYRNMLYLEATGRNDWSSTLPSANNSYFYPSVSASFVFSEVWNQPWLNYGKFRASWANTGNDAQRYQANKVYNYGSYNGVTTNGFSGTVPPLNLLPENQISYELGMELRLFQNRLGVDLTYYHNQNRDQIINLGIAPSTASSSITTNIGRMDNKGIELALNGTIFQTKDFAWNTRVNIARNVNEIIALAEGIDQFPLPSLIGSPIRNEARVGRPFGEWVAFTYARDAAGNRIVNADGLYVRDDSQYVPVGNSTPDAVGGFFNMFRYKGLTLNANIDYVIGGDIFSFTNYYGINAGKLVESLEYRGEENGGLPYYIDEENTLIQLPSHTSPSPNGPVYHDGVILEGVTEGGAPNEKLVSAFDHYIDAYFWNFGFHEEGLFDNSYVKMRELSLGYDFNKALVQRIGLQRVNLSLIGRNLFYIFKNVPNIDPEAVLGTSAGEASAFESGAQAGQRSVGFSLRIGF